MKTAIVILNYNNYEDTINCIKSVETNNSADIKYIVVDNGSTREGVESSLHRYFKSNFLGQYIKIDENTEIPHGKLPYLTFVVSKTNDGYACGNNKGLKIVYNDDEITHVLILNNDVLFVEDIIPELLNKQKQIRDCGIISPVLYKKNLTDIDLNCARREIKIKTLIVENFLHYFYRLLGKNKCDIRKNQYILSSQQSIDKELIPISLPSGSCMLLQKNLFNEIGSFDENTFLYFEEDILYKKIAARGLSNYLLMTQKCIHLGASSTKKTSGIFIMKHGFNSMRYYVHEYSGCNRVQKIIFDISLYFAKGSFYLQKFLMGKLC